MTLYQLVYLYGKTELIILTLSGIPTRTLLESTTEIEKLKFMHTNMVVRNQLSASQVRLSVYIRRTKYDDTIQ